MAKAKPHPGQLGFLFEAPLPATAAASLAGLERRISQMVGVMLNSDGRTRHEIAAKVTELLGEDVTKMMLDAYASEARDQHKVPASRLLAIVAVTNRHDLLDPLMREIGAAVLVGEEVQTARLGHIERQIAELNEERRKLKNAVPLIREGH